MKTPDETRAYEQGKQAGKQELWDYMDKFVFLTDGEESGMKIYKEDLKEIKNRHNLK